MSLVHTLAIVAAIVATSEQWTLTYSPGELWASVPYVALLATVLLMMPQQAATASGERVVAGMLLTAASVLSIVYTAAVQKREDKPDHARLAVHYIVQSVLLVLVLVYASLARRKAGEGSE